MSSAGHFGFSVLLQSPQSLFVATAQLSLPFAPFGPWSANDNPSGSVRLQIDYFHDTRMSLDTSEQKHHDR